ncbi:unnamed protein product [Rotaria magnacalcarata]|uniref:G-protein coupled receptors family 1 profile domain-containing protein n=1 Tax=Rotaria magnacalcarata TaxID=392030 RepID=A0A815Y2I6_9BILA|nr:unnamed protein product [Rotaria magnacalcarata]CAF1953535.1 unnamed protein product [Rotaria magnacalcarata]
MKLIANRSYLYDHCLSIDFLLRVCISMDQWLNASVATERAINGIKGPKLDKRRSKQVAKLTILVLLVLTIVSSIHDPIHRRLLDGGDEKRIWCIVTYASHVQTFNGVIQAVHFSVPFAIDLISFLIIIIKTTRQRSLAKRNEFYKQYLHFQLRQHHHLLISPVISVILALPRLIIVLGSGCMESARKSWLFLAGYFISFIPSMSTFLVFVMPSNLCKKEFDTTIQRHRKMIKTRILPMH